MNHVIGNLNQLLMKTTYHNRYGDEIIFEQQDDTVTMTGYNPEWIRYALADDADGCNKAEEHVSMVDPSGGPYLTIGSDLSFFWGDKQPRIIKSIRLLKGQVEFKISNL
jgi:hypothetical protein